MVADVNGLRDSVKDGETGFLFPFGNYMALASQVIRVLCDTELQQKLSDNAKVWAQTFTWDETAKKTMEIVDEIMSGQFR